MAPFHLILWLQSNEIVKQPWALPNLQLPSWLKMEFKLILS